MKFFKKNLELLRTTQPSLARKLERESKQTSIQVIMAKDGNPIPQIESISLHSNYNPLEEAARSLVDFELNEEQVPVIYGLGFGYHVLKMLKKYPGKQVLVIEPLMPLFQAFMESADLEEYLPKTKFIIAEPPPKILARYESKNWNIFQHLASRRVSNNYFEYMDRAKETSDYLSVSKLKILIVNPYYGGSLPTAKYCLQALNSMGHQAESVECERFAEAYFSLSKVTRNKNNAEKLSKQFNNFMGQLIAAKAADFRPDLILAMAQAPLARDAIENLKLLKVPIAFWFVEDFRTLTYWKEIASSYDYFYSIQRGQFFKELSSAGVKNHYYLPQACHPDIHRKIYLTPEETRQYSADISFMGAGYYNRQQSFPRLLNRDFKIWGTEWDLESTLGSRVQNMNKRIDSDEIVKIYNAGKVNLNLHSSTYHAGVNREGDFVNPRTFEISACEGFQLVDERTELAELMNPGSEVAIFGSIDELCEKINYYLNHEEEAKSIAVCGKIRVLKEHTIKHRMSEMLVHIFNDRLDQLKIRMDDKNRDLVSCYIEQVGSSSELGKYLDQFRGETNFSVKKMVDHIANGEGNLSKEELLILMVDQLVKPGS